MCKTYYVDPLTGKDENDGLHEERAFATLFAVNRLALAPGDTVLLRRGCRFEKQFLQLQCSGTEGSPITIGAYGEGCAPCIAADGQGIWYQDYGCALDSPTHLHHGYVSSAVLLYDAAYVTVRDLEITNRAEAVIGERYSQADKMQRTGVAVVARDKGIRRGITLQNLLVHDVNGNVYDKHMNNGGIYMTALRPENEAATGAARFGDILVEGCYVAHVSRWGIAVGYTYAHAQFQGAADVNMGRGAIVIGLAAVIIGEVIFGKLFTNFGLKLLAVSIGAVIYYFVLQIVLQLGLNTNDLKLITALIVALFLAIPYWKGKMFHGKAKKEESRHA